MSIINQGILYQRKYESDNNARRRFLLANSNLKVRDIKTLAGGSLSRKAFSELVTTTQSESYWKSNDWLYETAWSEYGRNDRQEGLDIKQCPLCAEEVFHSHLYSFYWMQKCPIHHVELTFRCTECGRPWPVYNLFIRNPCATCGTERSNSVERRRKQIREHTDKEKLILDLFWSIVTLKERFANILYYDYISYGLEQGILRGHKDYPEFAILFHPEHSKLFSKVCMPPSALSVRDFKVKQKRIKTVTSIPVDVKASPRYQKAIIREVEDLLSQTLSLSETKKKALSKKAYPQVDFIDEHQIDDFSYTVWRALIDTSFERKPASTWWMRVFELLKIPQPVPPPHVNLIVSEDKKRFYLPSKEFCKWLYKQHLINLFIYIHKHFSLLLAFLSAENPNQTIQDSVENMVVWQPKYSAFRILIKSNKLIRVVYKPMPSLMEVIQNKNVTNLKRLPLYDPYWQETLSRYYSSQRESNLHDCVTRTAEKVK